jgi:uncharacterized BrkB/YihY/UPF0761 family membrane protein
MLDFWKANLSQALHDTWVFMGAVPFITLAFTGGTAVIIFLVLRKIFPPDSMREKFIEAVVSILVVSVCATLLFLICVFFIAPPTTLQEADWSNPDFEERTSISS